MMSPFWLSSVMITQSILGFSPYFTKEPLLVHTPRTPQYHVHAQQGGGLYDEMLPGGLLVEPVGLLLNLLVPKCKRRESSFATPCNPPDLCHSLLGGDLYDDVQL